MPPIKVIAQAFWRSFQVTYMGRHFPITTVTAWDSMVMAASEEWVDETVFRFAVTLPDGMSYSDLATRIVDQAIVHPDLDTLQQDISRSFLISERDAITAIDRALGGLCRAATLWPRACPDRGIDPVAAAAFDLASEGHTILDSIYPGWAKWRPGCHSEPQQAEQDAALKTQP